MRVFSLTLLLTVAINCFALASASNPNLLFPDSLKLPLIGPSEPASVCMLPEPKLELENQLNAKVDVDCVRLSVSAVEAYDEEEDVFLLLAYADILHDRGWKTIDMVSGIPLIKSPISNNDCSQHLMISGGLLSEYFPDETFSNDEGQYIFLSMFMDESGDYCGASIRNTKR